jgi:hypothetical protein
MFSYLWIFVMKVLAIVAGVIALVGGCSAGSSFAAATVAGTPVARVERVVAQTPPQYSQDNTPGGQESGRGSGATGSTGSKGSVQPSVELVPGVPLSSGQGDLVAAARVARSVDPCALHDIRAAQAISGLEADAVMPSGRGLHICALMLAGSARELPGVTLTTSVGVDFDQRRRGEFTEEQIGGVGFFREKAAAGDERVCRYVKGFGEKTGIELAVRVGSSASESKAVAKSACQVAQEYLAAVGPVWREPAAREDRVSTPLLVLGGVDPCAGVVAVAVGLGQPVTARLMGPYGCALVPVGPKVSGTVVAVELGMETDPRALLSSPIGKEYSAVTVAGRPGVRTEITVSAGRQTPVKTCHVTVVAEEKVTVQENQSRSDSPKSVQVVKARAGECAVAIKAAEGVLAALR